MTSRGLSKQIHPDRKCLECCKCHTTKPIRWHHKANKPHEYLNWLKLTFNISPEECLCNSCNLFIEKTYQGNPPLKKKKYDRCHLCSEEGKHQVQPQSMSRFLELMQIPIIESPSNVNNEINLCGQHYSVWRERRFSAVRCEMPNCGHDVKVKHFIPTFDILMQHFREKGESQYLSLSKDSILCKTCYLKLWRLSVRVKLEGFEEEQESLDSEDTELGDQEILTTENVDTFTFLQNKLVELKNVDFTEGKFELIALNEILIFVAQSLISDEPILFSHVYNMYRNKIQEHDSVRCPSLDPSDHITRSPYWLKNKLEHVFSEHISLYTYQKNNVYNKHKGTLILRKNADTISIIHDMVFIKTTNMQFCSVETDKQSSCDEDFEERLPKAYCTVISDLKDRYQSQIQDYKIRFGNCDLSKIDLCQLPMSIDPFIWNFHFFSSQTNREWRRLGPLPSLSEIYLPNDLEECSHSKRRVLRTLFSVCHNLFQVSSGECSNPLHMLLADTIDTYSGSAKLASVLNTFGVVSNKQIARDYIKSIVEKKTASKFIEDLNANTFTVISVDNIDIGQPNASVNPNVQNRGIHATTYQAVQPKPNTLVTNTNETPIINSNEDIKIPSSVSIGSFALSQSEIQALSIMKTDMFQYALQKHFVEGSDMTMPNLKLNMAMFNPFSTDKAKVVYLGVINEPCDNIETIRHVLEKIHDNFQLHFTEKHMITVGDAKTYDLFCKLKVEYPEELAWVIPFPGDWHVLKNAQPVIFKIYFDAGLKEIAKTTHKEDGLLTILQQCTNFRKTHTFLLNVWECFYVAEITSFFKNRNSEVDFNDSHCKATSQQILKDMIYLTKELNSTQPNSGNDNSNLSQLKESLEVKLNLKGLQKDFLVFTDTLCKTDDTFRFWHNFIHRDCLAYISLYLSFRSSNWDLRLAALKILAPLFHAYDRHMYLRLIPQHLFDMLSYPSTVVQHLQSGGFSATITGKNWQQLALDESHESFINLDVKQSVRKPSPELLDNMAVYLPYRASLQNNLDLNLGKVNENVCISDKGFSTSYQLHEKEICSLYLTKIKESKVFDYQLRDNRGLIQLFTSDKAEGAIYFDLMNFYSIGQKALENYINARILKIPSTKCPVRKHVLRTFTPVHSKTVSSRKPPESKDKATYNRCLKKEMAQSIKTGKPLQKFNQYIVLPRAIAMADGGMHHQDTKSNATKHLNARYEGLITTSLPSNFTPDLVILEGMFIINSSPIRSHHKTFSDLAQYLVRRWIFPHFKSGVKQVHVLFDRPGALKSNNSASLKEIERSRRDDTLKTLQKELEVINAESQIPAGKWAEFLKNRGNKKKYIQFLSKELFSRVQPSLNTEQTFVLNGCFDFGKSFGINQEGSTFEINSLTSNHEESDTLVWLHVVTSNATNILVFSPDTDVYFIGLPFFGEEMSSKQIFIQMNMLGDNNKYLNLNQLADSVKRDPDLGGIHPNVILKCIQILYICSGCDYVSFFVGFGKAFFFNTLHQYSSFICGSESMIPGLLADTSAKSKHEGFLSFLRLIGCMYFKKHVSEFLPEFSTPFELFKDLYQQNVTIPIKNLHENWLDCIRQKIQGRVSYEDEVPPSTTALELHWLRSCLVSQMYEQSDNNLICLPDFCKYGYQVNDKNILQPQWEDPIKVKTVQNHVEWLLRGCKCKTGCIKKTCKCKKKDQKCGPGCSCLNCQNSLCEVNNIEIEPEDPDEIDKGQMTESDSDDESSADNCVHRQQFH